MFLTTRWSIVLRAGDLSETVEKRRALEALCRDYWFPLYAFLRRQGHSEHDAQDYTQGFFERFLRRDDFQHASSERGRFRSFLLTSLRNHVSNERRAGRAKKRGGEFTFLSFEEDLEDRYEKEAAAEENPESLYNKSWARALLDKVANRLEQEYAASEKSELYASLRPLLSAETKESHAEIGSKHGLTAAAVTMTLHRMRGRYGELLRSEIAETVEGPGEVEDEIKFLLDALAS